MVAAAFLTYARMIVELWPFAKAIRWGSIRLRRTGSEVAIPVGEWVLAVRRASRVLPWRTVCIHQSLALQRLLRSRGIDAILCYGTMQSEGQLKSHVWVKVGGEVVIGGEQAPDYHLLATYPGEDAGSGGD